MQPALPARERHADASRLLRAAGAVAAAVGIVVLVAAAGSGITGATAALPLADPGALVRWGLPVVRGVADLAAAVTLGTLVLTWAVLPAGAPPPRPPQAPPTRPPTRLPAGMPAHPPALRLACAAAALWALAGLARLVLGYAAATGQSLGQPDLGTQLASYATQVDTGRWAAAGVVAAALTATLAAGATRRSTAVVLTVLAAAALAAEAFAAHAGAHGSGPAGAVALGLHVAGVAVWVGGLAALLLLSRGLGGDLVATAARWARLAGWAFAVVGASGAVTAWQQLGGAAGLRTGYGALVLAKVAALAALGVLGALYRRRVLPAAGEGRRAALGRAVAVELAVALLAIGLSAALASTEPPASTATTAAARPGTLAAAPGH